MPFIGEKDRSYLKSVFEKMEGRVKILLFTEGASKLIVPGERPCQYCQETVQLIEELASTSDKISVEVFDRKLHPDKVQQYAIPMVPAIVVTDEAESRRNVRYFGIPAGYEFGALVEDIVDTGNGKTRLAPETREQLAAIATPVHLRVFVTPTCPYCPRAVRLAHQFAMENPNFTADMIEATEFPDLAGKYNVYGVPKTIINETGEIEGAVPEAYLLQEVLATVGEPAKEAEGRS
ncbi:MAG: thioredoxin family protein [Bacillota bacterium]